MDFKSPEMNIKLRQLGYLSELARSKSWTDAADRLGVSQPALSQSMRELEQRLNVRLFEAVGRRRVLTDEGRQTVSFAREILNTTDDLRAELHARGTKLHGRLRVGMIDAASLYVLPDAIKEFRNAYPDVDLELTVAPSTPLLDGLRTLEQDLVFVTGPVDEPGLDSEIISTEPLFLYGPDVGDPVSGDWIMYPGTSRTRGLIDRYFIDVGWNPHIILESANPAVLSQMVGLGFGWAVLPEAVAESGSEPLAKRSPNPVAHRLLVAVWRGSTAGNPRIEAFRSTVGSAKLDRASG